MLSPTFGSLFAGIGGLDLGLERAGWECRWQVEIDDFCQKVLTKHWPNVPKFRDIKTLKGDDLEPVDLICGGFPCQPFSVAGKQRGSEDDRYLWPEMLCIIEAVRPTWILGENVPGIIRLGLDNVLSDLEALGYATRTFVIPACAVNAPHRRDRVWVVADTNISGLQIREGEDSSRAGENSGAFFVGSEWWDVEPDVGRVAHGVPSRVDRLKSLGNAVVPQVAEAIGRMILEAWSKC